MSEMRASIVLDLAGNLQTRARQYEGALSGMARSGQRSLSMLSSAASAAGRGLDALGNRYTGLLTGAGAGATLKYVSDLEDRFTYLGIQANTSGEEITKLKERIFQASQAANTRIDPGQLTAAVEAIVEKTGDLDFATNNLQNLAVAIRATGAEGGAIGEIAAELQKMGIKDPKTVMEVLDTLTLQGKEGAFTVKNLAALGPRVMTAYAATGRSGAEAMREMGAALQVIRMGTEDSSMAATAFEAVLSTLMDPAKIKLLSKAGIKLFDPEQLKQGRRVLRPINELMTEIVTKANGDKVKIGQIFDREAIRAFNQLVGEFQRDGGIQSMEKFMSIQGDGSANMRDAARAAEGFSAAMTSLYTSIKRVADEELAGPIRAIADAMNAIGPEASGKIIKGIGTAGLALGGLVLARKAYTGIRGIAGMFGGKAGAAGAAMGGLGLPVPLPVYIVNSRMSLMPGEYGGGRMGGAAGVGGALAKSGSRWSKLFGRGGSGLLTAGLAAAELGSIWMGDGSRSSKIKETGGAVGGLAGSLAGMKAGAALGTVFMPGIGTAIGALGGSIGGYFAGKFGGETIGKMVAPDDGLRDDMQALIRAMSEEKEARILLEVKGGASVTSVQQRGLSVETDVGLNMGY